MLAALFNIALSVWSVLRTLWWIIC